MSEGFVFFLFVATIIGGIAYLLRGIERENDVLGPERDEWRRMHKAKQNVMEKKYLD